MLTVGFTLVSVIEDEQMCEICVEVIDGNLLPGLTAKVDLTFAAAAQGEEGELVQSIKKTSTVLICFPWAQPWMGFRV